MTSEESKELALKYAPIIAQKVSVEWKVADQIAPVDFAGSIEEVSKNPQKIGELADDAEIPAKIYYSVCETTTHYFLIYAACHVLDWWKRFDPDNLYDFLRDLVDEHVHDMEGALLVVTKAPDLLVDAVVTVAHYNFYLYAEPRIPTTFPNSKRTYPNSLCIAKFNESVDRNIWLDKTTRRVRLYIEPKGHGIWGDHKRWGAGESIWFYGPKEGKKTPGTIDPIEQPNIKSLQYELEDIFEGNGLWAKRFNDNVLMQKASGQWGLIYREKNGGLKGGAANPPWSWNDHNDTSPIGEIATDPAPFIIRYA